MVNQSTNIEVPLSADEITHLVNVLSIRQMINSGDSVKIVFDPDQKTTEALILVRLMMCLRHAQGQEQTK